MHVAEDILEKKLDQDHTKKIVLCDFCNFPTKKDDDSDDIMDGKNGAYDN